MGGIYGINIGDHVRDLGLVVMQREIKLILAVSMDGYANFIGAKTQRTPKSGVGGVAIFSAIAVYFWHGLLFLA